MNYREKTKKDPAEKKIRKLSAYIKKYPGIEADSLKQWIGWEEAADRKLEEYRKENPMLPADGEDLYMAGWIGGAGTLLTAEWKKEALLSYFPIAFINTLRDKELFGNLIVMKEDTDHCLLDPFFYLQQGASWIAPVGEGGLMKALYRLGKESGLGFQVQAGRVPVRQITIEFSEYLRIHPWEMLTGAAFLFTAVPNRIRCEELEAAGMICSKIGSVTKDKQKLICHGEEKSNINRPEPDALLNLLLEGK